MNMWKAAQYECTVGLTLRAVLSNEALVTDTPSILTTSLVLTVPWAGQHGTVWSGETIVTHTVAINAVTSV